MTIVDDPGQYFSSRILRLQAPYQEGRDVRILQSLLNLLPDHVTPTRLDTDGIFGFDTLRAVREFQKYFKLDSTGIVSDQTFYYLGHCSGKFSKKEPIFSSRIISSSSQGRDVQILQNRLAAYKKTFLNRPATGKYDLCTAQAVSCIQDDFSIQGEEGVVGPRTYTAILLQAPLGGRILKKGLHGLDTYFLQIYLHQLGYYDSDPNGYFSAATFKALKKFQHAADIRVDGIAGPQTFLALGNSLPFPQSHFFYHSQTGDSITSTASLFKRTEASVLQHNGLKPSHKRLKPGQLLKMPGPLAFHLLKKGDSIDGVAEKYDIDHENLLKANRLQISMGLIPGETLVLPGCQANLTGCIAYLNRRAGLIELKSIHLQDMNTRILHVFNDNDLTRLSIARNRTRLNLSTINGLHSTYDLNANRLEPLPQSRSPKNKDQLLPGSSLKIRSIIKDGRLHFSPDNSTSITADTKDLIRQFQDKHITRCLLSPDGSYMLIFASTSPARENDAYIFNAKTGQLLKIAGNSIDGLFSTDSRKFLLISRKYFGAYYPWFYTKIELFSCRGNFLSQEMLSRSAEINKDCFNSDNTSFVFAMSDPHTFYPLPDSPRYLYIKKLNSSLLLQLTSDDKPFSPVWI
ncbi:hypothetical protein ASZ90_019603 [hydrocarbon metagenome]|uniref:LysM domain-containing protein n=1 Tax=hydrocarbon metagenome TaxID=938273 RepID=A0A0W8E2V9_9ZZZZ